MADTNYKSAADRISLRQGAGDGVMLRVESKEVHA